MKISSCMMAIALAVLAAGAQASGPQLTALHAATVKPGAAASAELVGSGALASQGQTRLAVRISGPSNQPLQVVYRTEEGLVLVSPQTVQLVTDAQGKVVDTPVVEATRDGVHYLNVFITVRNRSRVVSLRLDAGQAGPTRKAVGSGTAGPGTASPETITPDGQRLIILPAD